MQSFTSQLQALADSIDFPGVNKWVHDNPHVPITVGAIYLAMVFAVPKYMKDRPAFNLKPLNILWNLLLTVFSVMGSIYCMPRLYEMVMADSISGMDTRPLRFTANMTAAMRRNAIIPDGFREGVDAAGIRGSLDTSVCVWKDDMYQRGVCGMMALAFMFSKMPEMIDTAFLVFQKKKLIFLHWYHHISVMLFCWHSWLGPSSSGLWFAAMNYGVHSVMYFYYFVCACGGMKFVRPFASLITFLQILQMIIGSSISTYVFYMDQYGGGCDCSSLNTVLGLLMYLSYFYLFAEFFVKRYITGGAPASKKGGASKKKTN